VDEYRESGKKLLNKSSLRDTTGPRESQTNPQDNQAAQQHNRD